MWAGHISEWSLWAGRAAQLRCLCRDPFQDRFVSGRRCFLRLVDFPAPTLPAHGCFNFFFVFFARCLVRVSLLLLCLLLFRVFFSVWVVDTSPAPCQECETSCGPGRYVSNSCSATTNEACPICPTGEFKLGKQHCGSRLNLGIAKVGCVELIS